ncbi:MAG: hypothetical protein AAFV80_23255, partial [Bacteroidota bacterium]
MLSQKRTILALTKHPEHQMLLKSIQNQSDSRLTVRIMDELPPSPNLSNELLGVDLLLMDFTTNFDMLFQTLSAIKTQEFLRCLPVVGIGVEIEQSKVEKLYGMHINALVDLSTQTQPFHVVLNQILQYWLEMIIHPQNSW